MAARSRIILVVVHRPRHDGGLFLECASRQRVLFQYSETARWKYCPRLHRGHVRCNWVRVCDDGRIERWGENRSVLEAGGL